MEMVKNRISLGTFMLLKTIKKNERSVLYSIKCALFRSHISVFAGAIKGTKTFIIEEKHAHARFARNIPNFLRVDHVEETKKKNILRSFILH